jgi:FdhD protein
MADVHIGRMVARVERDGGADEVAIEEPLEIRVDGAPLSVTMRTPGHDEELALGFLYGEGLIDGPRDAGLTADLAGNVVEVAVHAPPAEPGPVVPRALLAGLPARLTAAQPGFARTGGLHAAGLFTAGGELLFVREDVGRHNALDKVVGRALLDGLLPLGTLVLCVSGRLSFELVQKAAVAGCPILVGVGAPTSLAVDLAAEQRITLCGFARGDTVNVYTEGARVG